MAYLRDSVAPKRMGNATKRNQIAIIVSDVRIARGSSFAREAQAGAELSEGFRTMVEFEVTKLKVQPFSQNFLVRCPVSWEFCSYS